MLREMPRSSSVTSCNTDFSVSSTVTLTRLPPFLASTPSSRIRCVSSPTLRTAFVCEAATAPGSASSSDTGDSQAGKMRPIGRISRRSRAGKISTIVEIFSRQQPGKTVTAVTLFNPSRAGKTSTVVDTFTTAHRPSDHASRPSRMAAIRRRSSAESFPQCSINRESSGGMCVAICVASSGECGISPEN
jgi:hypothetical protein